MQEAFPELTVVEIRPRDYFSYNCTYLCTATICLTVIGFIAVAASVFSV
jgi:hypothetical protein